MSTTPDAGAWAAGIASTYRDLAEISVEPRVSALLAEAAKYDGIAVNMRAAFPATNVLTGAVNES